MVPSVMHHSGLTPSCNKNCCVAQNWPLLKLLKLVERELFLSLSCYEFLSIWVEIGTITARLKPEQITWFKLIYD